MNKRQSCIKIGLLLLLSTLKIKAAAPVFTPGGATPGTPATAVPVPAIAPAAPPIAPAIPDAAAPAATPDAISQPAQVTAVPGLSGMPSFGGVPGMPGAPAAPGGQVMPPNLIQQSQEQIKEGVDTISEEDSGNWYEKRRAWKKARPKYDETRKLVSDVDNSIKEFFDKNKEFEKELESFYFGVGAEQGEVLGTLQNLISRLEKERDKKSDSKTATTPEAKQLAEIQAKKQKDLETLKSNLEKIKKINENVRDAIMGTLVEQVRIAKSYEDKSLESYYRISEILDDRKARNLLHDMDTYIENIQAIQSWINGELKSYVDQSTAKARELIEGTKKQIEELKTQGITLKKQLTEKEQQELAEKQKKEAEEKTKAEVEKLSRESLYYKTKAFFSSLGAAIKQELARFWTWITNGFSSIGNWLKNIFKTTPAAAPVGAPGAITSAPAGQVPASEAVPVQQAPEIPEQGTPSVPATVVQAPGVPVAGEVPVTAAAPAVGVASAPEVQIPEGAAAPAGAQVIPVTPAVGAPAPEAPIVSGAPNVTAPAAIPVAAPESIPAPKAVAVAPETRTTTVAAEVPGQAAVTEAAAPVETPAEATGPAQEAAVIPEATPAAVTPVPAQATPTPSAPSAPAAAKPATPAKPTLSPKSSMDELTKALGG